MGKTSRFLQFKCSFPFFRIYSYISIKGGENLDSNGPEHICMSWITKCVQKASITLWAKVILKIAGFINIWFTICNLVWLMLNYANSDTLKKTKVLLRALEINQFEMAQNLRFNLLQQESWITSGGGDSDLKSTTIQT